MNKTVIWIIVIVVIVVAAYFLFFRGGAVPTPTPTSAPGVEVGVPSLNVDDLTEEAGELEEEEE